MKRILIAGLIVLTHMSNLCAATSQPNEYLGAEYGAYDTGKDRNVSAGGKGAAVLSLAGEWRCELDAKNKGVEEKWFARKFEKPIHLPGTLDEAGLGQPRDDRTLRCLSRKFEYIGPAWYQREITVPPDWAGKHITMTFERVMWESRVWIDEQPVGARDSLCTPHEYDLTGRLTPGTHRLTVRVDNSGRPGANCHGYGDDEQIRWNGLLGRLELRAQDVVFVRSAQVYPDVAKKRAVVRVEIGNIAAESFDGTVTVKARPQSSSSKAACSAKANFKIAGESLTVEIVLPFGENAALWDEFSPNLYDAQIEVVAESGGRKTSDRAAVTFGLRELGQRGTQLTMNGRTLFLRGTHDGGGFPLTGHPAMDVEGWRKIFRTCKEFGLNHVRYHSFCPPEAAFTAADEEGIILLAELPVWGHIGPDWAGTPFLRAELRRILDAYGNHPSFCMMSMGNEHSGDWDVLGGFVADGKRHDPRHLYAAASNEYIRMGKDPRAVNDGDEFAVIMKGPKPEPGYEQGRIRMMERLLNGEPPAFDADYRDIVKEFDVPTFAHELGQYWVFPDPREAAKYTGVLRSGAMELFRDCLASAGLLERAEKFHQASGALAVRLYKEDIERELRTPGLGGFQLLDLHDYTGQNTSLIGLLDAFWETKGIVAPAEFRRFCAPTVVLARLPKVTWTSDETLTAQLEVAHYGAAELTNITPEWKLISHDGHVVASGTLPLQAKIPTGRNATLGRVEMKLKDIAAPIQLRLEATVGAATNDWNVWVYPAASTAPAAPGNVRITEKLDADTLRFAENGGRVLLLGHQSAHTVPVDFPNPIWNPFGGNIQTCGLLINAQHPALAKFPTATHADWQWRDLLEPEARAFVLNDLPLVAPIAEVIDQPLRAYRLGVLIEASVGKGVVLATSLDLDHSVAGRQLRCSLLDYLASDRCQPTMHLAADEATRLLTGNRFLFAKAAPADASVVLDVEPSANAPAEGASKWKPAHDRVVKRENGFDYDFPPNRFDPWKHIPSVTWKKNGKPAWMSRQFTLRLRCPPDFTGTVYLQFRDVDSGKAVAAVQSGRDACYIGAHDGEGKWVVLSMAPADLKDGVLEITVGKPAGGDSWSRSPRITRLVVAAAASATAR